MAAGTISETEFRGLVEKIIQASKSINDLWERRKSPNDDRIYLVKRHTAHVKCEVKTPTTDRKGPEMDMLGDFSIDEEKDDGCLRTLAPEKVLTYEYHVLYSESYSVPVLYFNIYQSNGSLVPLEEVWKMVPDSYQQELQIDKWSILTQQEHPILGQPFYQLHPCHTAMMMKTVQNLSEERKNYLVSWLSAVGPVVGLKLPLQYANT